MAHIPKSTTIARKPKPSAQVKKIKRVGVRAGTLVGSATGFQSPAKPKPRVDKLKKLTKIEEKKSNAKKIVAKVIDHKAQSRRNLGKYIFEYFYYEYNLTGDKIRGMVAPAILAVDNIVDQFSNSASEKTSETLHVETVQCLPTEAPEIFQGNRGGAKTGENIVSFLRRVWGPWIDAGLLTRTDLRRLDKKAETGIVNWLAKDPLPDDLWIPTKKAAADALVGKAFQRRLDQMDRKELMALRAIVQRMLEPKPN